MAGVGIGEAGVIGTLWPSALGPTSLVRRLAEREGSRLCGEKSPLCGQMLQTILSNCYEDEHGTFRNVKKCVSCLVWGKNTVYML